MAAPGSSSDAHPTRVGGDGRFIPVAHVAGAVALAAWCYQAWCSHGTGTRALSIVASVQLVAWMALAIAAAVWRRVGEDRLRAFFAWAAAFRLAVFAATPLMEDDFARYLWDGWRLCVSGNPYARAPVDFFADPAVPEPMRRVLDQINHPGLRTIYGPGLQVWFGLAALVKAGALWPLKLLLLAADAGLVALLWRGVGARVALLYSWCPLVVHETGANAHAEVLAILPFMGGWMLARRGRWIPAGVLLGIAVAAKMFVLPLVPFVLGWPRFRSWLAALLAAGTLYLPFWLQGDGADRAGLSAFLGTWEFNSSLVGLLGMVLAPAPSRAVPLAVAAGLMAVWWWRWRRGLPEEARFDWVLGVQFAASAVVNPWYLLWLVPFVALRPSAAGWAALPAVVLSYATAMNLGIDAAGPYNHPVWVRPVEYGAVVLAFAWDIASARCQRTRPP